MALQETRVRVHREQGVKSVKEARCALCHRLIRETSIAYLIDPARRRRLCLNCAEEE